MEDLFITSGQPFGLDTMLGIHPFRSLYSASSAMDTKIQVESDARKDVKSGKYPFNRILFINKLFINSTDVDGVFEVRFLSNHEQYPCTFDKNLSRTSRYYVNGTKYQDCYQYTMYCNAEQLIVIIRSHLSSRYSQVQFARLRKRSR